MPQVASGGAPLVTVQQIELLCTAVHEEAIAGDVFGLHCGHLFFFALVWAAKQGNDIAGAGGLNDADGLPLSQKDVVAAIERIATNLSSWGEALAVLKGERVRMARETASLIAKEFEKAPQGSAPHWISDAADAARLDVSNAELRFQQEWELLRIQVAGSVDRYRCVAAAKDEAVSDCLLKLLTALARIPAPQQLQTIESARETTLKLGGDLVRLYDFFTPFYAYARRAAHNALMDVLARLPHNDADEMILALTAVIDSPSAEGIDAEFDAARFALRIDFERMLAMVDNELPERQHQVVRLTLALRPQFKRALLLILGVVADDFPEPVRGASIDQVIAAALTRQRPEKPANENDVRVLRFHAKKKITTLDAVLGALLMRFMDT